MNQEYEDDESMEEAEGSGFVSYEELMEARKITFLDIKEHLTGPVISTVIHVVLLAFLGTIVVFKAPEKSKEITVEMKTIEPQEIEPPPPPPEPPDPVDVQDSSETPVERPDVDVQVDVQVDNISVNDTSDVELPSVLDMKMSNSALTLSVPVGGGRNGGGVAGKFLGTGGSGSRFMFILDYSASMSKDQLLVLKSHLMKALKAFKGRGQVAILFFAGPTWLPQENGMAVYKKWGGKGRYDHFANKDMRSFYPKPKWMVPNAHNLAILDKYICQSGKVGGTNWSHPFRIALENMDPKPQVIFFMTDGNVSGKISRECIDLVKKYGEKITINTIGFGVTAGALKDIAKLSKGGVFKGYSKSELKSMAKDVTLPTSFTKDTDFDYRIPRVGKISAEKKVEGLTIE